MRCIQFQTPLAPLHLHLKHKHPSRTSQLLWLSTINEPTEFILHRPNNRPQMAPRPKALPSFLVLDASSAAKAGGDISVLLPTGAALFFLYFIANFLVPNFISKGFQLDKESGDQKESDDDSN